MMKDDDEGERWSGTDVLTREKVRERERERNGRLTFGEKAPFNIYYRGDC